MRWKMFMTNSYTNKSNILHKVFALHTKLVLCETLIINRKMQGRPKRSVA
jgi:hypothetical protein